jgi:4-hydroxybenzoate polyprenyltransferase
MHAAPTASPQKPPLAVDLDGTLTPSDSLIEAILYLLLRKPLALFAALQALTQGRAYLKRYLAEIGAYHPHTLPLRRRFLSYLESEHAKGRPIYLVTAADQDVANTMVRRVPIFEAAFGSRDGVNLKGSAKRALLEKLFPGGFSYAGNEDSDLEIWRAAKSIILVGAPRSARKSARALGVPVEQEFPSARADIRTWLRALRIHQWAKNALLFVPILLAHRIFDTAAVLKVVAGFFAFGLVASATYLLNDLSDLVDDRLHNTKKDRPLARGDISPLQAIVAAAMCGFVGLAGAFLIEPRFGALSLVYIVVTVSYSLRLKAIALLDVFVLGALYTLRIMLGMALVSSQNSAWLLVFSLFFFYSLSMAKRHVEIVRARGLGLTGKIAGRGYLVSDEPFTLAVGVASGMAAVLVLFQYIVNDAYPATMYPSPDWLWLVSFFVFVWITRVWLKSRRGKLDDDAVLFALKDKVSWMLGFLVLICFVLASI